MNRINDYIYRTRKKQNKFSMVTLFVWILFMILANFFTLLYLFKIEFVVGLFIFLLIFNIGIFMECIIIIRDIYFFMTNQGFYFSTDSNLLTHEDIVVSIEVIEKIKKIRRNMTHIIITSKHLLIINFKPNIISITDIERVKFNYQGKCVLKLDIVINKKIYTYFCNMNSINNIALLFLEKYKSN